MARKRKNLVPIDDCVQPLDCVESEPACYNRKEFYCTKEMCGEWYDTCKLEEDWVSSCPKG